MKTRTIALAGSLTKHAGMIFGLAVMVVAVAEGMNAVWCLFESERG